VFRKSIEDDIRQTETLRMRRKKERKETKEEKRSG
jgi:hypothetical protein